MPLISRTLAVALIVLACAAIPLSALSAQPPAGEQQEAFISIDKLPPEEQLPAAPLLVGAYSFVVVVLFLYVASVARRLSSVQREVDRLEAELKRTPRT
jgi:CcmD family protein